MRYFVAGNFWLFVSLTMFLLGHNVNYNPDLVAIVQAGNRFSPLGYGFFNFLVLLVGLVFLYLSRNSTQDQ